MVQELLKEVAQTQQVDQAARQRFKVVVINEADHLTRDAQAALRRTMEKYSPNLRLILLANSTANIIAPIRSRTLLVRVAAPTELEICQVLKKVGAKEGWTEADGLNKRIARDCGRNLRRALLMFEAVHAQKYVGINPPTRARYQQRPIVKRLRIRRSFRHQTGKRLSHKWQTRSWRSTRQRGSYKFAQSSMIYFLTVFRLRQSWRCVPLSSILGSRQLTAARRSLSSWSQRSTML